jgi:drug/metabolite transporter (DMT)-like permease
MPAAEASLAATTGIVVATALQAALLGEHLGRETLLGATLIVAAIAVAARRR